jgi:signal transduction histidine kinase
VGILVASLPTNFAILHQSCGAWCSLGDGQLSPAELQALPRYGLSLDAYAALWLGIMIGGALVWFCVAMILFWRKSNDWLALLVALMLISWGVNNATTNLLYGSTIWRIPENGVLLSEGLTTMCVLALFPNGRFVPRWTAWVLLINPAYIVVYVLFLRPLRLPGWAMFNNPVCAISWFGSWIILVVAQLYRYVRVSTPLERQQTKWVALSFVLVLLNIGILAIIPGPLPIEHSAFNTFLDVFFPDTYALTCLLIPISFGLAMFRYRLWDIDIIINRTVVYGLLTAIIVGLYVFAVGYLGALFHTGGNLLISLIAAGLIAVLFQPLRVLLQRGVNRLLYGLRDEPYRVLSSLGQRMQDTLDPDAVLTTIVETVKDALKLSYVAIEVQEGSAAVLAAASGTSPAKGATRLPLVHQREPVGTLLIAPRGRDEMLSPADYRLLENLADQISIAVHAVRLTSDLQRMASDLQRSRERLVLAREEERRRLRRDLHDDLGPTLAALALTASNIADLIPTNPDAAISLANSLQNDIRATVGDIRRLVYELRPPALDELGLVAAIRERAVQFGNTRSEGASHRPFVQIEAPQHLPPLPAAVEVAAYRIVQEALTNVTRHANARTCVIRLSLSDSFEIEIIDDGIGLAEEHQLGVGLLSMRERAAELGGTCIVEKCGEAGTRVFARLPLSKE